MAISGSMYDINQKAYNNDGYSQLKSADILGDIVELVLYPIFSLLYLEQPTHFQFIRIELRPDQLLNRLFDVLDIYKQMLYQLNMVYIFLDQLL